jgi:hypothetical protein
MQEFTTVFVSQPMSAGEMEEVWDAERRLINLPKLTFRPVDSNHWRISFHEDHGALKGIENAVQQLRMAIHRRYSDCTVE